MIISQLTSGQLEEKLAGSGLFLNVGPFIFQIQTTIDDLAEGLRLLYGEFPIASRTDFADFHIRFRRTRRLRRRFCSYVSVEVDGHEPAAPVPLEQVYAVFEGCLNWCIYAHAYQYLIIHAAAIERGGRAAILPAPPGSGKSTLCAALVSRGWRLLTDELTLIATDGGKIIPIARPISLKNDSVDIIKNFAPDAIFGPISPNTVKGTIAHMRPPPESVRRVGEYCPATWLIVPSYQAGANTKARPMSKAAGFMRVAESAVNYMTLGQLGFDLVSNLIDETVCYGFEFSDLHETVNWFDELTLSREAISIRPAASNG
ncbi:MAG: HprK-related kinase A [Alphaproteobacteria bacterium]